ncbi:hypothetical protein [Pseudoclavibacter helvolus]|uniref:hypothetical protein n=1 Tax=Pseudoclavibacter helvolus TaxID=255205 RepID=UPI003C77C179
MSALPKPTARMSSGVLRLVPTPEQRPPESRTTHPPTQSPRALNDARLLDEVLTLRRENAALCDRLNDTESKLKVLQQKLRGLQRSSRAAVTKNANIEFANAEEWARHHIHLAWLESYLAADRAAHPLGDYVVGPAFAESVRSLAPQLQAKAWRAAVDIVTVRGRHLHSRGAHPLRSGNGPHAHDVVRAADNARCFRYSVGFKAAGARRMHAWHLPDGRVELSRVVTHGDMSP